MKVGEFKEQLKDVPDHYEIEIFNMETGEWDPNIMSYLQVTWDFITNK